MSHVCGCSPLHCTAPGVHEPTQAPDTHAWPVQALAEPHCPDALHDCTPLLEHWVVPGTQAPMQAPATQAWLVQATGLPQAPVGPQVSTLLPTHWVAPGTQAAQPPFRQIGVEEEQVTCVPHWPPALHVSTSPEPPSIPVAEQRVCPGLQVPAQAPAMHTYEHGEALPHVPPAEHVSTPPLLHWVEPEVHAATHDPLLQTFAQGAPVLVQLPVESQVCGCCPLHCCAPGVHVPVQDPFTHAKAQVVPMLSQFPVVSHACGWRPEHCVCPWAQAPEHAPATHTWPLHVEARV